MSNLMIIAADSHASEPNELAEKRYDRPTLAASEDEELPTWLNIRPRR